MKPLPFDPKKLHELSERLLVSHHENNYAGAVKNLNKVELELVKVNKDTPGFLVGGLKRAELIYTNSAILHEHYFGNLGSDGKPSGSIEKGIATTFGTLARFEELYRATALSLGGGSGWVILDYNLNADGLQIYWAGDHTQSVAFGQPLLVLDLYEHAYHIDFGASVARYIDAFFQNVNWEIVDARYQRALRAAKALRG